MDLDSEAPQSYPLIVPARLQLSYRFEIWHIMM